MRWTRRSLSSLASRGGHLLNGLYNCALPTPSAKIRCGVFLLLLPNTLRCYPTDMPLPPSFLRVRLNASKSPLGTAPRAARGVPSMRGRTDLTDWHSAAHRRRRRSPGLLPALPTFLPPAGRLPAPAERARTAARPLQNLLLLEISEIVIFFHLSSRRSPLVSNFIDQFLLSHKIHLVACTCIYLYFLVWNKFTRKLSGTVLYCRIIVHF